GTKGTLANSIIASVALDLTFLRTTRREPGRNVKSATLGWHDDLADRPEREPGKLQVRPGERNADDGDGEQDGDEDMAERQPPAGQHQPDDIADDAERPGADVLLPGMVVARHRLLPERQQRVGGDAEGRPRPGDADDGDHHDDRRDRPADRHLKAAEYDP